MMSHPEPIPDPSAEALADELDQVIEELGDLQAALAYDSAKGALDSLLERLRLTPREASSLQQEVCRLTELQRKLEQTIVHIAVFGLVGRGKSSVLNALVGAEAFATGPTHGVTQQVQSVAWQNEGIAQVGRSTVPDLRAEGAQQSRIELIDTPGLDEIADQGREEMARAIASQADLILFVISGDITRVEYDALIQLRQASKPMLLVFNKIDQYPEADRIAIHEALLDDRLRHLISADEIVLTAAAPLMAVRDPEAPPEARPMIRRGRPQIEDLKLKILEVLDREGLSLIALNTMLYADEVNESILAKKLQIRNQAASDIIWNGVMAKAIAVALNPITVLDVVTGAIADIAMIATLSRLYGLPMTQTGALQLLRTIALEMGGVSVSELLVTFGLGSLKSALGASAPATGGFSLAPYTAVAITQGAIAGVATYVIGLVTQEYLANGAQWGAQGSKTMVSDILETLDEGAILSRIKEELHAKLKRPAPSSKIS